MEYRARVLKRSIAHPTGSWHKAKISRWIVITQEVVARDQPKVSCSGLKKIPKEFWMPKAIANIMKLVATTIQP